MYRYFLACLSMAIFTTSCINSSKNQQLDAYTERESIFFYAINNLLTYEDYDSLENANAEFAEWLLTDTATFHHDFPIASGSEGFVNILTSADSALRIYSWNTHMGGTMRDYRNIIQYRSNGSIKTFDGCVWDIDAKPEPDGEESMQCYTDTIYTFRKPNGQTIYAAQCDFHFDSQHSYSSLTAFCISDSGLHKIPDAFASSECTSELEVEYISSDWHFKTNTNGWDWIFNYDSTSQTFYIPIADENSLLTDQYNLYTFNGNQFTHSGRDGGHWLHPSIRKFDQLKIITQINKFLIRIDQIGTDNYRYASWSGNADMSQSPDIIIENGTYDESISEYKFSNGDYSYTVSVDDYSSYAHLSVTQKSDTIFSAQENI